MGGRPAALAPSPSRRRRRRVAKDVAPALGAVPQLSQTLLDGPEHILALQRTLGNAAVGRMIASARGGNEILRETPGSPPKAPATAGTGGGQPSGGQKTWLQPLPTGIVLKLPPAPAFQQVKAMLTGVPYIGNMPTASGDDLALVQEANGYFESEPLQPWEQSSGEHLQKRNKLTQMFEQKAYRLALYILEQSEEQAGHEKFRYTEQAGKPANPETLQLREAAHHLAQVQKRLIEASERSAMFTESFGGYAPPTPKTLDDLVDNPTAGDPVIGDNDPMKGEIEERGKNIKRISEQYKSLRETYGQRFPVLLGRNQDYDYIANAAPDELEEYVRGQASEVLENIEEAREKLSPSKIWSLPIIIEQTKQVLGIKEGTGANDAIQGKLDDMAWDQAVHKAAMAGLQIGLMLVGAALSGGASLAVRAVALGAEVGAGAVGGAMIVEDFQEISFKRTMARRVSLDAAKRLSVEEPGYGWLAFDIALSVLDVVGIVSAFRKLVRPLRAADGLGDASREVKALASVAGEAVDPVAAATKTATTLADVEELLRAQARVLKQEGKLAEGLTEELFVDRIMAGLRRQVATKGAIAEQQAGVLAKVIDGSHPNFQALQFGEQDALLRLLTEHGDWKSLVMGLERGGQGQIAKNLMAQRKTVVAELEAELKVISKEKEGLEVGPMKGGSDEAISDIDLQIGGPHAGEMLIQAEAIMARRFGANWSSMFRLNFYTAGSRLTRYQEALELLIPLDKAGLTKRMTRQAEAFNFARMIQHAGDDAEAISRIERMAERMGVNLEELRPLAKMDDAAKTARRDELLREVDKLEAQYKNAKGAERAQLAEQISAKQMEANFHTKEANIGPGSIKSSGVAGLEKMEAYQGALTQLEMIEHILAEAGGDLARAAREYELWKYIGRFADVAQKAGIETPKLRYMRNQAKAVAEGQRELMEETAHLYQEVGSARRPGVADLPQYAGGAPPVTARFLESGFQDFMREANEALVHLNSNAPKRPPIRTQTPPPGPGGPAHAVDFTGDPRVVNRSSPDRYYVVDASSKKFYAEAHLEGEGELSLSLRTVDDAGQRSTVLRGQEQFKSAMVYFGGRVKSVRGAWNYGDNLKKFNELTAAGKTAEEAAVATWTGEQAVAAGYRNVAVVKLEGSAGSYTKVEVLFQP